MDLTFGNVRPAKGVPVVIFPEPTPDGERSQLIVVIEFRDSEGAPLTRGDPPRPIRRKLTLGPAEVRRWVDRGWLAEPAPYDPDTNPEGYNPADHDGMTWSAFKFSQLYDMVPQVPQSVLDLLDTKLPPEVVEELWEKQR